MSFDQRRPGETREMRLVGKVIELNTAVPDGSLPEFIARRRAPGSAWRTWDEISFQLAEVVGEIINDRTLNLWAKRYGIPEDTGRVGTAKDHKTYVTTLGKAGIDLP